jgi:cobalt-zinc-cadmium efflux system membrane fusion protein
MKNKKFCLLFLGIALFCSTVLICSCSKRGAMKDNFKQKSIFLTQSEIAKYTIEQREIKPDTIRNPLLIFGIVVIEPEQTYQVGMPISGFIKKSLVEKGEKVFKNHVLASIEHESYLDLKNDFLIAKSDYNYQKESMQRQGELAIEQATSIKKFEETQHNFQIAETRFYALRQKMLLLGITPEEITPEKLDSKAFLLSPVDGKIIEILAEDGRYYTNSGSLYVLSTSEKKMICFELDTHTLANIKINQPVMVLVTANESFSANILSIKQNMENAGFKTVFAEIPDNYEIDENKSVQVEIQETNLVLTIPIEAVVGEKYILLIDGKGKITVEPIQIISTSENGYQIENIYIDKELTVITNPSKKLVNRLLQ